MQDLSFRPIERKGFLFLSAALGSLGALLALAVVASAAEETPADPARIAQEIVVLRGLLGLQYPAIAGQVAGPTSAVRMTAATEASAAPPSRPNHN